MEKTILITGSGGFIGSNLKKYLKNKYKLLTPRSYELDLTNSVAVQNYFVKNKIDFIIHCGSVGGARGIQDKETTVEDNKVKVYQIIDKKRNLIQKNDLKYDKDGNIIQNEKTEYFYNQNFSVLTEQFSRKYVYKINEDDFPPDFEYFENDVLKMRNKYSSQKGNYTSQVFFEDDFSVKTYYIEEKKVKEVYYSGESVLRVKNYDKQ